MEKSDRDLQVINKTMDVEDLSSEQALVIVGELNSLIEKLKAKNLKISSWYGRFDLTGDTNSFEWINRGYGYRSHKGTVDDINFPWFLYWEIIWIVINNEFSPKDKVLDLGGSSSLFSYYLASKGVNVTTIDLSKELVDNATFVGKQMGWDLTNYVMDMREISFDSKFNHITSVCVYEHIPMYDRVTLNKKIKELLVEGGKFSMTFDYRNPSKFAQIGSAQDVYEQFVKPSEMQMRGNKDFIDNGKNYLLHPFYYKRRLWMAKIICIIRRQFSIWEFLRTKNTNDYTFGALFLEKSSSID